MEAAVKAVTDWSKNYREISKFYGVEKQKLFRVVNGAQKMDAKKGRPKGGGGYACPEAHAAN